MKRSMFFSLFSISFDITVDYSYLVGTHHESDQCVTFDHFNTRFAAMRFARKEARQRCMDSDQRVTCKVFKLFGDDPYSDMELLAEFRATPVRNVIVRKS